MSYTTKVMADARRVGFNFYPIPDEPLRAIIKQPQFGAWYHPQLYACGVWRARC